MRNPAANAERTRRIVALLSGRCRPSGLRDVYYEQCAALAATGIGAYPDVPAAIRGMSRIERHLDPRPEHRERYDATYAAYTRLHPAIAPIVRTLSPTSQPTPEGAA